MIKREYLKNGASRKLQPFGEMTYKVSRSLTVQLGFINMVLSK